MSLLSIAPRMISPDQVSNKQRGVGCDVAYSSAIPPIYGYDPTLAPGIVFSLVFGLAMVAHCIQFTMKRKWWYSAFALGALGEFMGWVARAVAHKCPYNSTVFSLQIAILIISPCFFSAGIYIILGQLINRWGRAYSLVSPRMYLFIFITFDVVSVVIQGIGGGLASKAGSETPHGNTAPGTHIMLAGIIIQLISMCIFVLLWCITLWRARALLKSLRALLIATTFSAVLIVIRNFYRAVELAQGWRGYLITHEVYFCVLDGALMAIAVIVFNVVHPAWAIDGHITRKSLDQAWVSDAESAGSLGEMNQANVG